MRFAVMDETFYTAQRRHRRTAHLHTALAGVTALVQAVPAAIILSPVTIGVAVVGADVVNLVTPTPDLLPLAEQVMMSQEPGAAFDNALLPGCAAAGVTAMVVVWWLVRRFLLREGLAGVLISAGGRPPDRTQAEEHQLVNLVEEISIAAGIQPPRVLVLPAAVPNAAAFGRRPDRATVAVSRGLLDDLDRDATQGVVAYLIATVANGDLRIRHALLSLFLTYALAADMVLAVVSGAARRRLRPVLRMAVGRASPEQEADAIRGLLAWKDEDYNAVGAFAALSWQLPQLFTNFIIAGLLALPSRWRTYLADATAVQLTRTPDGLGRALVHLQRHGAPLPGAEWASIYTVAQLGDSDALDDAVMLPASLHPPIDARLARLERLGFTGRPLPSWLAFQGRTWLSRLLGRIITYAILAVILGPVFAVLAVVLVAGLVFFTFLGFALCAMLALPPTLLLHALLRGAG